MKVDGVELTKDDALFGPYIIMRGSKKFAFWAEPCWTLEPFFKQVPEPENKDIIFTKNGKQKDPKSPAYRQAIKKYNIAQWGYIFLVSLAPSKIEFDSVSIDDPSTWGNVEAALKEELGVYEFAELARLIDEANSLDQAKIEVNRESFLLERARLAAVLNSQNGEATSSPDGEHAPDGTSDLGTNGTS